MFGSEDTYINLITTIRSILGRELLFELIDLSLLNSRSVNLLDLIVVD